MRPFTYVRAEQEAQALTAAHDAKHAYLAGGTTLIDLMKLDVERPTELVDINRLPLAKIEAAGDAVRIGALAKNSDVADHPLIKSRYPALSEALLSGASPQLRNMASVGGNLLQRTRCPYFRDVSAPCNKRTPGSGCAAWEGYNRMNAVLGGSQHCIAVNPSDMCVALVAFDAVVHTNGPRGARSIPIADFHVLPGDHPERETVLEHGELITFVELPPSKLAAKSHYLKVRDRSEFAFALASTAIGMELTNNTIREVRVALGGVATRPWRSKEAEKVLTGHAPSLDLYRRAATVAMQEAVPRKHNAFKVELMKRTLVRALSTVAPVQGGET